MSDGSSHFKIKEEPLSDGEGNGDKRILPNPVEEVQIIYIFKCNYCDSTFSSITDLESHETSHTTTQNVACINCGMDFDVTETVKQLSIHGEKCIPYFKITTTRGTKEIDIPKSFAIAKFLCKYCRTVVFESQAKLTEHRKKDHNVCDHCGKMFEYQSNLNRHLKSCKGGRTGPTVPPGTTSEGATEDPQKATGEKRKRSQDETLESATKKRQNLPSSSVPTATITSEHPVGETRPVPISKEVGEHSTEIPFVCEECHRFVSVTDFEGHVHEKHPGYNPFKCAICFDGFAKLHLLEQHYKQVHSYKP